MKCQSLVSEKKKKKKKKKKQHTHIQKTKQTTYITNLSSVEFTQRDWINTYVRFSFKYYKVAPLFMASVCFSCPQIPSENVSTLKGKNALPERSSLFPSE